MRVTDCERALLQEMHRIKRDPLGKRLIHFCVSLAPECGEVTRKIENAKNFIKKNFGRSPYVEVFHTNNNDIFVAYSHVSISEVLATCSRVEKLFCDQTVITQRNVYNEYAFYKVSDAVKDLDKVFAVLKGIFALAQPEPDKFSKRPMSADNLGMLQDRMKNADLRNSIFNQPVYDISHKVPSIEFLEFYVASQQIETAFLPGISLSANPWLFHALGEEFDRAVLKVVAREVCDYRHKSFSVNVTLATLLGKDFAEFSDNLPTKLAGRIVAEIHKTDLVQHYGLIDDLRAVMEDKGVRICIDGVGWRDFEILSLGRLKPNFIKVRWGDDLLTASQPQLATFIDAVKAHDESEIVLSRCDNPKAFPLARMLGIRYVQGKLADQYFKTGMEL
jgi:EAL domain-containing protein (putative c-di-GMP-specific phosphodiesterase class I)